MALNPPEKRFPDEPDIKEPDIKEPDTKEPDTKEPDTKEPDTKEPEKAEELLAAKSEPAPEKKTVFIDDGRTIADMNVEGFRWHDAQKSRYDQKRSKLKGMQITRKERRAMMRGALMAILPLLFVLIACFGVAFWLVYLWLK